MSFVQKLSGVPIRTTRPTCRDCGKPMLFLESEESEKRYCYKDDGLILNRSEVEIV